MTIKRQRRWSLIAGVALAALTAAGAELRVVGTDLLGVEFSKALYEFAGGHDFTLTLALDGSRPGLDQLKAGRADLALLTLPPNEDVAAAAFGFMELAFHRVVVLVPAASPLKEVSLDQLGGIFGAGPAGIMRWGELGVAGDWADSAIAPHAPAAGAGIATEFFRHIVLRGREFKSNVGRYDSPADLALRLGGESRVLALAPAPLSKPGIAKMVPVSLRADEPAFLPTPENLHSGDYPLRLPLRVVFRRESARTLRPLMRFLLSDDLAPHFERAGLVPLPSAARRQQAAALEKL